METDFLVWMIIILALLIVGILIVTGSWDKIYGIFDNVKGVSIFG